MSVPPSSTPPHEAPAATPAHAPALEAQALVRAFGARRAVDGVGFTLAGGECLALFGPNGAGKTTLLRLLAGLLRPTSGEARVDGTPLRADANARARVGLISHQSMLYPALTARENVEFAARLYALRDPRAAAERALGAMRILDRADAPVRALSRGMQQRVAIARSTVHAPRIVLLDEPYTGLDAAGSAALTRMLETLKAGGAALVVVTHNVLEGLALASHAAIMRAGRLVRHEPTAAVDAAAYVDAYRALVGGEA